MGGALLGLLPYLALTAHPAATTAPRGLDPARISANAELLVRTCLPWLVGLRVFRGGTLLDYGLWDAPLALRALGTLGAFALAVALAASFVATFAASTPGAARRLGLFGFVAIGATLGGFLVSVMVTDLFSARYLAAAALGLPFALAPLGARIRPAWLSALLAPYLAAAAVAGWVAYGPLVRGAAPVLLEPRARAGTEALGRALAARGVRYAVADYWTSYRLTFLLREELVVVPLNAGEDRYAPYRRAFERAAVVAYVFDPARSREDQAVTLAKLGETYACHEILSFDGVVVAVLRRRGA